MTVVGVLNIVLGSLACVGALVTMLGGGFVAALGSAAEHDMNGATGQAAMVGGALIMFGVLFGAGLLSAGVGVLKMRPWGRSLSLAAATLGIVYTFGQAVLLGMFGISAIVGLVYPVILVFAFMSPAWKRAFAMGAPVLPATDGGVLRYRDAA